MGSLKVVERMAKLSRVGPDESTSLRKLCQWSFAAFNRLMEVIKMFEVYETLDVKASRNSGRVTRCEKLTLTNFVFNKLAKCDEKYFESECEKVLLREISLKTLVENNQTFLDIEKVYSVLSQISGYKSKQKLLLEFPGKFDVCIIKRFIGAEIKGIGNCFN